MPSVGLGPREMLGAGVFTASFALICKASKSAPTCSSTLSTRVNDSARARRWVSVSRWPSGMSGKRGTLPVAALAWAVEEG